MEIKVGDYTFNDEETAEKARKEAETISFIRNRTDFSKPENAKKILATIQKNNMFETQVGLDFVARLEAFIENSSKSVIEPEESEKPEKTGKPMNNEKLEKAEKTSKNEGSDNAGNSADTDPDASSDELDSAPAFFTAEEEERLRDEVRRRTQHLKDSAESKVERIRESYKSKARNLTIVIVALVAVIIGLLVLTFFSDSSPFYNAEEAVLNKYSAWQEELQLKEQQLTDWEKELKQREDRLNGKDTN